MDWHRLFGLVLTDFFTGSPYVVELEKDLSLKQQFLDVVIVRKEKGEFAGQLPDGLDNLANHNLISFKSYQEALDDWAVKELIGHYVNYRKQVSPSLGQLLAEAEFRLYAVCARFPAQLASQVTFDELRPGVYECRWGTDVVRVVVVRQLPEVEHNAPMHLFSATPEQVQFAALQYRQRSADTSTLIQRLIADYRQEGINMPYTMEDFRRDVRKEALQEASGEQIASEMPREKVPELLRALVRSRIISIEDLLHGLSREEIEEYLRRSKDKPANATD